MRSKKETQDRIARGVPGTYPDGKAVGLHIQIKPQGGKSWVFRFQINKRVRWMGLGGCDIVPAAKARKLATDARAQAHEGIDPIDARCDKKNTAAHASRKRRTFKQCVEEYHAAHRSDWRSEKYAKGWLSSIEQHASTLMDLPVHAIDLDQVADALSPIWGDKRVTAQRVRNGIELVLDMAIIRKYRPEGVNPAGIKGIKSTLGNGKKAVKHHEALPHAEIAGFIAKLRRIEGVDARALEFLILNANRSGEVRGARWDEIDMKARTWTIPGERMKGKQTHVVPLSDAAMAILGEMAKVRRNDFVFPAQRAEYINALALPRVLERVNAEVEAHGFRSTFRDWAGWTKVRREVCEIALAHKVGNAVEQAYWRDKLLDERREVMDAWARYCDGETVGNVTKLELVA
jgi:integrase